MVFAIGLLASAAARGEGGPWRRADQPAGIGVSAVVAIAHDGRRGAFAVGTERGLRIAREGQPFRDIAVRAPLTDLHFDAAGNLWIGTTSGLWRLDPGDRLRDEKLSADEAGRWVHRIVSSGSVVAAATKGGVHLSSSRDERGWHRVVDGLPAGPVRAAALAPDGEDTLALWVVVRGLPWRVELSRVGGRVHAVSSREVRFAERPVGVEPVDLVAGFSDLDVVIVYPRAVALRPHAGTWSLTRPVLPSGASAMRLSMAAGRAWLATDGGVLEAESVWGPWVRSRPPAGQVPALTVVGDARRLWAATASGLLIRSPPQSAFVGVEVPGDDPPIAAVHAAALSYTGLEAEQIAGLYRGLRRRGWIPRVSVDAGIDRDRHTSRDFDESFVSGATRHLFDRDEIESLDVGAGLLLTWELGRLAYDPEVVDLSREARQIITLRDNVLDEINQIYFERRALMAQLAGGAEPELAGSRRIRVDELRAGLDAWTGGWFSQRLGLLPSPRTAAVHR